MCLCVVVVSPFRLCHITRVYVGFSFLSVIYTVSLSSQSRLSVVFVPFCRLIFIIFYPSTVFLFKISPPPADLCLGKQQHALQRLCLEKETFSADVQIACTQTQDKDLLVKP